MSQSFSVVLSPIYTLWSHRAVGGTNSL